MKKILKIIAVAVLALLLLLGGFVALFMTGMVHVLFLSVSNQNYDGKLIVEEPSEVAPVYVEVKIDDNLKFARDVEFSQLESILGAGAGGFDLVLLWGSGEHEIEVSTDLNDNTLVETFSVDTYKKIGLVKVHSSSISFSLHDKLELY